MNSQYIPFLIFLSAGLVVFVAAIVWSDVRPYMLKKRAERERADNDHTSDSHKNPVDRPVANTAAR
ncbi:MAG: hypothetical protein ABSB66_09350 [Candidatus Acidiferrales bacterium]